MGFYIRYISTDERKITLPLLERVLKMVDTQYAIVNRWGPPLEIGDLIYANDIYGQIEINRAGDDLFEEELDERKELLKESRSEKKRIIWQMLNNAKMIVTVQVLWQKRDTAQTCGKINSLLQ